ncbi:hypothetical protein [Nakamurella sp. PAMC28650]|uniref:hypothetical protein n=1 Tax=Nakamurella sp. PAMC28650 TaxID=2762325 RepID=UPI00164E61F2|nr:hypothetical protein [Nakamurella sp. PAMC28650]QNK80655.1 hypothetical protein H7F38_21360 [Nakamurella sp. PAMC28650]
MVPQPFVAAVRRSRSSQPFVAAVSGPAQPERAGGMSAARNADAGIMALWTE